MNRSSITVVLLGFFMLGSTEHASAQFWKNWFHKEQPHKHRPVQHKMPPTKPPVTTATTEEPVKEKVKYPDTHKKSHYRIDVFAPVYLDELVGTDSKPKYKSSIPDKALAGIDFYEGVKIAADTLNAMGYQMDVYFHDMEDITQTAESLINSGDLDATDLIIGSVQSHQVGPIARFAKSRHINFISALSPSDDGVKDNPYFTLLQPSLQEHCEWIMNNVRKKYGNKKITMLYRTNTPIDESAYKYVTDAGNDDMQKLLCNIMPGKEALSRLFDSTHTNVVVVTIMDHTFAEALLKQLYAYFPKYSFEVYGMPSWKNISSLRKADAFPNIGVNITDPFYFDLATPSGQYIENVYRREYGGRPGESVYRGYEALYWYAHLLKKNGTIFNKNMNDEAAPFTKFDIKAVWDNEGKLLYDANKHLYLYRYQSGSYIVQQ